MMKSATYRIGQRVVGKQEWQEAVAATLGKRRISIMLDGAIVEYFKAAAGDRGYQTLINDTLRRAMQGDAMLDQVRLVVREELKAYKIR